MLTKRGSIIIDERTNTLIITDLPRNLPLIDDLIAQLDVQIQQVQIEARVVEATKNWQQAFGVQWPTSNQGSAQLTVNGAAAPWGACNGPSWNSINNRSNGSSPSTMVGFSPGQPGVTDLSAPAGQFWLSFLSNRMSINVILQALETEGRDQDDLLPEGGHPEQQEGQGAFQARRSPIRPSSPAAPPGPSRWPSPTPTCPWK